MAINFLNIEGFTPKEKGPEVRPVPPPAPDIPAVPLAGPEVSPEPAREPLRDEKTPEEDGGGPETAAEGSEPVEINPGEGPPDGPNEGAAESETLGPAVSGGAKTAERAPRRPKGEPAAAARGRAEVLPRRSIRDLPGSLVEMAVRASGNASVSNIRAVEAFLFANRDRRLDEEISYADISSEVAELAQAFDTARERREFDRRIASLERKCASMDATLDRVLWAVVYLVWHSTGLRTDAPMAPDEIKFDQDLDGFEATMRVLEQAVEKYRKDRKRREGRPIR